MRESSCDSCAGSTNIDTGLLLVGLSGASKLTDSSGFLYPTAKLLFVLHLPTRQAEQQVARFGFYFLLLGSVKMPPMQIQGPFLRLSWN